MGIHMKIKVVKNKVVVPFRVIELNILLGEGIDKMGSLLDGALDLGIVQWKGRCCLYQDTNFAQGHLNAGVYLKESKAVVKKMEAEIHEVTLVVRLFDVIMLCVTKGKCH
jgi:recombination protein RecA